MKRNIDIKEPCTEDFSEMTPTERGSFCNKCATDVHDFRDKSAAEIRDVLRLNIGTRVCGRVTSNQLTVLNADFEAWEMNSKRSFQSALIFSLIVVFGMTLFSCQQDEQANQINSIQKTGMALMEGSGQENGDELGSGARTEAGVEKSGTEQTESGKTVLEKRLDRMMINQEAHFYPDILHETVDKIQRTEVALNAMAICEKQRSIERTVLKDVDGLMMSSYRYDDYLQDVMATVTKQPDESTVAPEEITFDAFTFPNPAFEKTTLRIVMPKAAEAVVEIFNLRGELIERIQDNMLKEGENYLPINLLNMPSGSYLIWIRFEGHEKSVMFVKL
jgi:hypothetical protein